MADLVAEGTPEEIVRNPRSLTGKFLEPVLAAGPLGDRPRFPTLSGPTQRTADKNNGKATTTTARSEKNTNGRKSSSRINKVGVPPVAGGASGESAISAEVKAPWEIDGRQWHTRDRVAANGRPRRWDGHILETIVDRVEALSAAMGTPDTTLTPTDWSQRNIVRINGADKAKLSFPIFHATTSSEWVVHLRFFVPKNTFRLQTLEKQLKLVPFHESPTPVMCDQPRVKVEELGPFQEIVLVGHTAADFETPGFDAFLRKAVAAYLNMGNRSRLKRASELDPHD